MSENHSEASSVPGDGDSVKKTAKADEKEARIDTAIKQLKDALLSDTDEKYGKKLEKDYLTTSPKVQFERRERKREGSYGSDQRPPISAHDEWLSMRLRNLAYTRGGPGQIRYLPRLDPRGYPTSAAFDGTGIYTARPEDWFDRHIQKDVYEKRNEEMKRNYRGYLDDLALRRSRTGDLTTAAYDYRHEPWRYMEHLRRRDYARRLIPDHFSRDFPPGHELNYLSRYDYPLTSSSWNNYDSYLTAMSYLNGPIPHYPYGYHHAGDPYLHSSSYRYPSYSPTSRYYGHHLL